MFSPGKTRDGPETGRLPEFFAVGPQRTATTWLYEVLRPHVSMPQGVKETMFFDRYYHRGLGWYRAHFLHCPPYRPVGEIAPTYFHSEMATRRLRTYIPRGKIICTLREPVSRVYSLYLHMRAYGLTNLPFEDALDKCPILLDSSYYYIHVRRWLETFDAGNVLVLLNDDLVTEAQEYIATFCQFIGIEEIDLSKEQRQPIGRETTARNYLVTRTVNTIADLLRQQRLYFIINMAKRLGLRRFVFAGGTELPRLSAEMRDQLSAHFRPQIAELEGLLGRDLSGWRKPAGCEAP